MKRTLTKAMVREPCSQSIILFPSIQQVITNNIQNMKAKTKNPADAMIKNIDEYKHIVTNWQCTKNTLPLI